MRLMELAFVAITFGVVIAVMALRGPLWLAVLCGPMACALLFQMGPLECFGCAARVLTTESSLSLLLTLYLIAYLQRMLEARDQLRKSSRDLDGLLRNRRAGAVGSCALIGLLPSPAAVLICGDLMRDLCGGALGDEDLAFVTSWLRHVPESVMPTFPAVLLMAQLAGVGLSEFMAGMRVLDEGERIGVGVVHDGDRGDAAGFIVDEDRVVLVHACGRLGDLLGGGPGFVNGLACVLLGIVDDVEICGGRHGVTP